MDAKESAMLISPEANEPDIEGSYAFKRVCQERQRRGGAGKRHPTSRVQCGKEVVG